MQRSQHLLPLLGAVLLAPCASAAEFQSLLYLEDDTSLPVALGTMTFEGDAPGDGLYLASSFLNLTFSFEFGPMHNEIGTFSEIDLLNDLDTFSIRLIGTQFHFSGPASGDFFASAEFRNAAGNILAFSPASYPLFEYVAFTEAPTGDMDPPYAMGVYGAVTPIPEPSTAALTLGTAALGVVASRRRRA